MMELYLSYDNADTPYGKKFKDILKPVSKNFGCTVWSRQDVLSGTQWQREMASHLKDAWLFLPLISADYFASDRCGAETEAALKLAQQGKLRIVNVVIRSVFMNLSPLASFPLLPGEKPLANWRNTDDAWLRVQRGIISALQERQLP